jgi:thiamine biosynthesis lipoprotein
VTINNVKYGHIVNSRTGLPTLDKHSVTVLAPSAMLADWLSTAIFLEGEKLSLLAEKSFEGVTVLITQP